MQKEQVSSHTAHPTMYGVILGRGVDLCVILVSEDPDIRTVHQYWKCNFWI